MIETTPYDPADHLETLEDVAFFLSDAFETANTAYIRHALEVTARARGLNAGARERLSQALNRSGSLGLPEVQDLLKQLGLRLTVAAA